MKKLLICLLLICLIVTNFAACTKQGGTGDINTEIDTSENVHYAPSRALTFYPVEELTELKCMLEKSEEEAKKFLQEKEYDDNGLNSKKDIEAFFEKIGNLKTLHIKEESGCKLASIIYFVDYGYLMSIYEAGAGKVRVISYIEDELSANSTKENATVEKDVIVKGKLSISNKTVNITSSKNATGAYKMGGTLGTANSLVRISFTNEEILSQKSLEQNIVETTLNELMQQKQEK